MPAPRNADLPSSVSRRRFLKSSHGGRRRGGGRQSGRQPVCACRRQRHPQGRPGRLRRPRHRRGRQRAERRPEHKAGGHGRPFPGHAPDAAWRNIKAAKPRPGGRRRRPLLPRLRRLPEGASKAWTWCCWRCPPSSIPTYLKACVEAGQARLLREDPRRRRPRRAAGAGRRREGPQEGPQHRLRPGLAVSHRHAGDDEAGPRRGHRRDRGHRGDLQHRLPPLPPPPARLDRDGVPDPRLVQLLLAGRRPAGPEPRPRPGQGRLGHARASRRCGLGHGRAARPASAPSTATPGTTTPSSTSTPTARGCTPTAASRTAA